MTQPLQPIPYQSQQLGKVSGMAKTSMILGIIALPTACFGVGVLLGILALILGIISLSAINKNPGALGGKGFAIAGIITGGIGGVLMVPLLVAILLPYIGKSRELANRTSCAANINGILKGMVVYANDNNDCWPIPNGRLAPSSTEYNLGAMYYLTTPAGGNYVSTKSFLCKSDPDTSSPALSTQANFHTAAPLQCSYGIADSTYSGPMGLTVAGYWKNTIDASLPMMSDAVGWPLISGKPATSAGNSINHQGDGQNVGFGDAHVEWSRSVIVGVANDITGNTGTQRFEPPFDIWVSPQKAASNTYSFK